MANTPDREELLATLERERAALLDLLPRFGDEQWRTVTRADGWTAHDIAMHVADSSYGLALLALGEIAPTMQLNEQTGWMEVADLNQQRRQKNATLPREKVLSRLEGAFGHARRAIETIDDYGAPGPYGPVHTKGQWLRRIVDHAVEHRRDLEALLAAS
ncbi:MAG: DinB family protein [Kouleothrix sp.]|nr:DinB family protein [Kouleothrix sp.]